MKELYISYELQNAVNLIRFGLAGIQDEKIFNAFLHLPLLLLSSGYERLLKALICCENHEMNGKFPELNDIKGPGHRIDKLLEKIYPFFKEKYLQKEEFKKDYDLITNNSRLKAMIKILSDFASHDRYFFLDIIVENNKMKSHV